jgi:hypothetical protein
MVYRDDGSKLSNEPRMALLRSSIQADCAFDGADCLGSFLEILRSAYTYARCAHVLMFRDPFQTIEQVALDAVDSNNPRRYLFSIPRITFSAACAFHGRRSNNARRRDCGSDLVYFTC